MADDLNGVLQRRLVELDERRLSLQTAINRMAAEISAVEKRIDIYKAALTMEGIPLPTSLRTKIEVDGQAAGSANDEANIDLSKVSKIRREILRIGIRGFEPKQIAKYVKETGMSPHNAFAYNVIKRLKDSGELMFEDNLYFPTGKLREMLGQEKMSFE